MSIKPLSYHGFSLDFLVAGSNREKEGKRPGDIMAWSANEELHHTNVKRARARAYKRKLTESRVCVSVCVSQCVSVPVCACAV